MVRPRAARVRANRQRASANNSQARWHVTPTSHCTLCHEQLGLIDCVCGGKPDRPSGYGTGRNTQ